MELKSIGVTPKKEEQFHKRGIYTMEDLAAYLPTGYKDFSHETGILPEGEVSCISIMAETVGVNNQSRVPYVYVNGTIRGNNAPIRITWFNQPFLYKKLLPYMGMTFYLAGKVAFDQSRNRYNVSSPELFEPLSPNARKIYPTYRKIPGMSMDYLTEKIAAALTMPDATSETLPYDIVTEYGQLSRREALYRLHTPQSVNQIKEGQERILFDELLYFALHTEWSKKASVPVSPVMLLQTTQMEAIRANLPYELTADQSTALAEMLGEAKQNKRINALLQGDVGCGKTIVAILLMVAMAENGYQAVLMAPTQVLARQHYEELRKVTEAFGFKTAFLGADLKKRDRTQILKEIKDGTVDFVVGTHSVLSPDVEYRKLALTITDEEHKFGVAQRAALVNKAADGVHTLTMSATPIPRTLAQVIYGSLIQLHTICTLPAGRKPVITGVATTKQKLFSFILRESKAHHQTYVVCPLIDPSDKIDGVKSVEEVKQEYETALAPYGIRIATLTGRDKKDTVQETIEAFSRGDIDVLIATTVVEVGVNVPTASLMVISNAERFGLASLHQLRGRVGRSQIQSFCVLDCCGNVSKDARQRIDAMCATTDGFQIAKNDLAIRGAGDFLGTKQSGDSKYLTLMMAYPEKFSQAQAIARKMLDNETKCKMIEQIKEEQRQIEQSA